MNYYNLSSLARKEKLYIQNKNRPVEKAQTSKATIISMLMGILIMIVPISLYIGTKSTVTSNKIIISELNIQYDKLKLENDTLQNDVNSKVSLNEVYDIAVNKLNMKKLTVDKIKYYKTNMGDYFKQSTNLTK